MHELLASPWLGLLAFLGMFALAYCVQRMPQVLRRPRKRTSEGEASRVRCVFRLGDFCTSPDSPFYWRTCGPVWDEARVCKVRQEKSQFVTMVQSKWPDESVNPLGPGQRPFGVDCVFRDRAECTNADSPMYAQNFRQTCHEELVSKLREVKLHRGVMMWSWPDEGVNLVRGGEYVVWDPTDEHSVRQRCKLLNITTKPDTQQAQALVSYSDNSGEEEVPREHLHDVNAPEAPAACGMHGPRGG